MDKQQLMQWLDGRREQLFAVSDAIWDFAETDYREHRSAQVLVDALEEGGFTVERALAGIPTAFCARYGQGGPTIALLGEYDALSGLSQTAGAEAPAPLEEGGNGHGCGHNLLGTGSLGAALAVKEHLARTGQAGTIVYFGCPAEEGGSGKAFLARAGVFDAVDAALSWHPNALNSVWSFSTLANIRVHYRFQGISAHAAVSPHLGRSALDGLELMNVGVQFLREHIIPEARIHYAITNTGGTAPNVVQSEAEAVYLVRAPRNDQVEEIYQRVCQIAQGAALMSGTTLKHRVEKACSNVVVNRALEQVLYENMKLCPLPKYSQQELDYCKKIQDTMNGRQLLADRFGRLMGEKGRQIGAQYDQRSIYDFVMPYSPVETAISGSSDVGDVSWVCPTAQIVAATCAGGTTEHSWQMTAQGKSGQAHKGLLYAAKVLACAAVDLLDRPEVLAEAKREHLSRIAPRGYRPLLPPEVMPQL